jgi:enamine deaminase RidA (YjgF/YER057c/UK114 family)
MKTLNKHTNLLTIIVMLVTLTFISQSCEQKTKEVPVEIEKKITIEYETPEYFLLRPEVEKVYGYSHAVKISNSIKVYGKVSMDDEGNPAAIGDFEQQMKNCYSDLEKVLAHYG